MLATVAGLGSSTVLSARFVRRTGHYRVLSALGALTAALALVVLALTVTHRSLVVLGVGLLLLGFGIGAAWEVVVIAEDVSPRDQLGVATAGNGFVREMGVLLGTAGVGAWYAARVGDAMRVDPRLNETSWTALTPGRLAELPAAVADVVRIAYTDALAPVLAVPGPIAAAVLLVFLRPVPLSTRLDQSTPS